MEQNRDKSFYSIEQTTSATECTGLMPAMPTSVQGQEELSKLMAIHGPPGAMAQGQESLQWEHAVAHPSDEHNRQMKKAGNRPSTSADQNHQPTDRNPSACDPSQESKH